MLFEPFTPAVDARRSFVTSGAMLRLQTLDSVLLEEGADLVPQINALYPPEVVSYYREGLPPLGAVGGGAGETGEGLRSAGLMGGKSGRSAVGVESHG